MKKNTTKSTTKVKASAINADDTTLTPQKHTEKKPASMNSTKTRTTDYVISAFAVLSVIGLMAIAVIPKEKVYGQTKQVVANVVAETPKVVEVVKFVEVPPKVELHNPFETFKPIDASVSDQPKVSDNCTCKTKVVKKKKKKVRKPVESDNE